MLIKNFIGGEFVESESRRTLVDYDPSTGDLLGLVPVSLSAEIDHAVEAAAQAQGTWRELPLNKRIAHLSAFRDVISRDRMALAVLITAEHGKTATDAEGEITRLLENMTASLDPALVAGKIIRNIASGNIEESSFPEPVGTFAVITPFNFPAMIAFWFLPYALLTGNTLVIKPSEQTPLVMNKLMEFACHAELPAGVLNVVHGDKTVTEQLLSHPDIRGVASVSSSAAMHAIHGKATSFGKRALCQGGAKNSVVIMPDVSLKEAVPHIFDSFCGNSGQRCLAGGNLVLVGFRPCQFRDLIEWLKIEAKSFEMGPMISSVARFRVIRHIEKALEEGAVLELDGRTKRIEGSAGYWLGPTILSNVEPDMTVSCDEVFGPVIPVLQMKNMEQAVEFINSSKYGNAAMIFTNEGDTADRFVREVSAGNIGINIGLPAPVPPFPFGGMKGSHLGDLHGQGSDPIKFFTQEKVVIKRWLKRPVKFS